MSEKGVCVVSIIQDPEQMYLLPPSVVEVLSEEHLYFHVHRVLEGLGGFSYGKFVAER